MHFADNTSWVLIFLCSEIEGSDASSITGWSLVLWISFGKLRLEIFCCSFSHPIISVSLFWFLRLNSNISVYFSLIFVLFFSFQGSFRVDALFATRSFLILETYDPVLLNRNVKSNFLSVLFIGCFLNSTSQKPTQLNVMFWSNLIILESPFSQNVSSSCSYGWMFELSKNFS